MRCDPGCCFGGLPLFFFLQFQLCREVEPKGHCAVCHQERYFPDHMCECVHPDLPPTTQMFPMEDRGTGEGVALSLAFLRSGITGEMEEAIT